MYTWIFCAQLLHKGIFLTFYHVNTLLPLMPLLSEVIRKKNVGAFCFPYKLINSYLDTL